MAEIPRLNGVIRALEQGKHAFTAFSPADPETALAFAAAKYDGIVFEMEHNPWDVRALRDCLQYMLNRRQIAQSGSLAPAVTPMVRIPPNGAEKKQWLAKQALDLGVYGDRLAAYQLGRAGPQRGRGLPLSAARSRRRCTSLPACAATARPRRCATGASPSRNITSAPTSGRSIPRARSS